MSDLNENFSKVNMSQLQSRSESQTLNNRMDFLNTCQNEKLSELDH
jgi:hypothetical protein